MKAHGTGNDFVLLPDLFDALTLDEGLTRALCNRDTGLGADGVIRLGAPRSGRKADVFMDYRNADGSLAEMCGNGVRCVAKVALDRDWVPGDSIRVDTRSGVKPVAVVDRDHSGQVTALRVSMGAPALTGEVDVDISPERLAQVGWGGPVVTAEGRTLRCTTLSMGNPHAVAVVEDVATVPLAAWAQLVAEEPAFPHGVNVEIISLAGPDAVDGRIVERGSGETASSGTGAAAMGVAACARGLTGPQVAVQLPGGTLLVDWRDDDLLITGPAEVVAAGSLDPAWLAARQGGGRSSAPTPVSTLADKRFRPGA